MWSNSTSSPSIEQTRFMRIRPMSSSWSWLNRRLFSSVAGYTATGIVTRPNEMAPFHMALGGIALSSGSPCPTHGLGRDSTPGSDTCAGAQPGRALASSGHAEEPCGALRRVHRRPAEAAPRREAGRRLVDGGRRSRTAPLEPEQGVLARRGLHEGRPRRLLLQRRRAHPAASARAAPHDEADARRPGRRVLLREDRALAYAGLDRALHRPERGQQGGLHRLPDGER